LLFAKQKFSAWLATSPQGFFTQWCQKNLGQIFFSSAQHFPPWGRLTSRQLVSSRYVWRSLAKDVATWAKTCLHFQQSKIHYHARTLPLHIPIPHIDLVTPT
jgi:hypothetical protein